MAWRGVDVRCVGGLHGGALIVQRVVLSPVVSMLRLPRVVVAATGWALTYYWVLIAWIFFRAQTFADAMVILKGFCLWSAEGARSLDLQLYWMMPALGAVHALAYMGARPEKTQRIPDWAFAIGYALIAALSLPFVYTDETPFIYFQF